jgi:hypothetical protein
MIAAQLQHPVRRASSGEGAGQGAGEGTGEGASKFHAFRLAAAAIAMPLYHAYTC